ncbi:uncharacterized protein [Solanum lycopersicum]|uniref:uncharacterized protein n=1 Tax=Solanum lycopersicum TaxID=4081 RepID=UPI0002BCB968|nr:uncharacterized protein LOC101265976 [Solanum lycopersicum]
MSNKKVRGALVALVRSMIAQANRDMGPRVNAFDSTITSTLRDFVRMNPPNFVGSKLRGDMTLSRPIVYVQSIVEYTLGRRGVDVKRVRTYEKGQPLFKKRAPNQHVRSSPKDNYDRAGGFQHDKPTCSNCVKKHFGKCLAGTIGCFGCGKNDHKVRDCPTFSSRGRDVKKASYNGPAVGERKQIHFYALEAIRKKIRIMVQISYNSSPE